jgi:hypothetical protein
VARTRIGRGGDRGEDGDGDDRSEDGFHGRLR